MNDFTPFFELANNLESGSLIQDSQIYDLYSFPGFGDFLIKIIQEIDSIPTKRFAITSLTQYFRTSYSENIKTAFTRSIEEIQETIIEFLNFSDPQNKILPLVFTLVEKMSILLFPQSSPHLLSLLLPKVQISFQFAAEIFHIISLLHFSSVEPSDNDFSSFISFFLDYFMKYIPSLSPSPNLDNVIAECINVLSSLYINSLFPFTDQLGLIINQIIHFLSIPYYHHSIQATADFCDVCLSDFISPLYDFAINVLSSPLLFLETDIPELSTPNPGPGPLYSYDDYCSFAFIAFQLTTNLQYEPRLQIVLKNIILPGLQPSEGELNYFQSFPEEFFLLFKSCDMDNHTKFLGRPRRYIFNTFSQAIGFYREFFFYYQDNIQQFIESYPQFVLAIQPLNCILHCFQSNDNFLLALALLALTNDSFRYSEFTHQSNEQNIIEIIVKLEELSLQQSPFSIYALQSLHKILKNHFFIPDIIMSLHLEEFLPALLKSYHYLPYETINSKIISEIDIYVIKVVFSILWVVRTQNLAESILPILIPLIEMNFRQDLRNLRLVRWLFEILGLLTVPDLQEWSFAIIFPFINKLFTDCPPLSFYGMQLAGSYLSTQNIDQSINISDHPFYGNLLNIVFNLEMWKNEQFQILLQLLLKIFISKFPIFMSENFFKIDKILQLLFEVGKNQYIISILRTIMKNLSYMKEKNIIAQRVLELVSIIINQGQIILSRFEKIIINLTRVFGYKKVFKNHLMKKSFMIYCTSPLYSLDKDYIQTVTDFLSHSDVVIEFQDAVSIFINLLTILDTSPYLSYHIHTSYFTRARRQQFICQDIEITGETQLNILKYVGLMPEKTENHIPRISDEEKISLYEFVNRYAEAHQDIITSISSSSKSYLIEKYIHN